MENNKMGVEESLQLINTIIQKAKTNFTDNGDGWLIWGTMIFLASLSTYFL